MPLELLRPDKITPVLITFRDKEIAKSVYTAEKKLAKSGIFISENLNRQRRNFLNTAREKYGNKCAESEQGHVFIRLPNEDTPRRVWSIEDML